PRDWSSDVCSSDLANPTTLILSDFMGELSSRIAAWSSVGFGKSERKELPAKAAVSGQYQGKALDGRSAMEGSHRMQCRITLPFNSGDVKSRSRSIRSSATNNPRQFDFRSGIADSSNHHPARASTRWAH